MDAAVFENGILAQLGPESLEMVLPHLREFSMEPGSVLYAEGAVAEQLYFPSAGAISLVLTTETGDSVEVGLIGKEGALGTFAACGLQESFSMAGVQARGAALRMPVSKFVTAYERSAEIRNIVNRYHLFLLYHAQQSAACNAIHPVSARMCRWLLEVRDRVGADRLYLRQEFLAQMLGVQRTTVTLTEGNLKTAGLVAIGRGYIEIKDLDGIRRAACPCYESLRRRFRPVAHRKSEAELPLAPGLT
jgi:CRP-like cAMP-binding protein